MTGYAFTSGLRRTLHRRMAGFVPVRLADPQLRGAAVTLLIADCPEARQASIVVTVRAAGLRRHGGQYALPGGRLDAGETERDAAMRETSEELGLDLAEADILGRLDDFPTRSGFCITPFVAWAPAGAVLRPDPAEVARVIRIPFAQLDDPGIPVLEPSTHGDHPVMSAYFEVLGHRMYAPTAAILYQFREIALRGETRRVSHFDQPGFAWS
ncbi:MAG: CoA pyrophosphatase [Pseudomonadota bacterium]